MATDPEAATGRSSRVAEREGARTRLDGLARRYYAPLVSFFRKRTHNASEVPDLVQQVFVRLAQCSELDGIHNPDGYIFQTAANTLKDHLRHNAVRKRFAIEQLGNADALDSDFSPERVLQGRENIARLTEVLRQMPERTRDILMLRCFEGLKHSEIARLQGISVRAVEKHVAKALACVSQALERDVGESGDAV